MEQKIKINGYIKNNDTKEIINVIGIINNGIITYNTNNIKTIIDLNDKLTINRVSNDYNMFFKSIINEITDLEIKYLDINKNLNLKLETKVQTIKNNSILIKYYIEEIEQTNEFYIEFNLL